QLKYPNDLTQIEGFRTRHLSVVNQVGKKNIPLHVGFVGSNFILNNSELNPKLVLRLTNVLKDDGIPWTPTGANASKLTISFDAQGNGEIKEWALGTQGEVNGIDVQVQGRTANNQVEVQGWTREKQPDQGGANEWVVTNQQKERLEPGEFILLTLSGVKSS